MKTEEEYIEKLKETCESSDKERNHIEADYLLCDALRQLGWEKLANEFRKQSDDFWYA